MPEQLYGWTKRDIDWLLRLLADLRSGKAQILRRREATSAPNVQTVKASSATLDTSDANEDRYPGHWYERNPSTGALTQKDAIWIVTPNGEDVTTTDYYECAVQRGFENSRPVFCAIVPGTGGGTTITVKEADGTPSYSSISTVSFDQADGFVITNPSAGVAQVDISAATSTTSGVVSSSAQTFGGDKTFNTGTIYLKSSKAYVSSAAGNSVIQMLAIDSGNNFEYSVLSIHTDNNLGGTVPGCLLAAKDSSNNSVNAYYGVTDSSSNSFWGVWGTDAIGNVIKGGIITTAGFLNSAPATSGSTGTAGQLAYDTTYLYVCTATNTWKRLTLATF